MNLLALFDFFYVLIFWNEQWISISTLLSLFAEELLNVESKFMLISWNLIKTFHSLQEWEFRFSSQRYICNNTRRYNFMFVSTLTSLLSYAISLIYSGQVLFILYMRIRSKRTFSLNEFDTVYAPIQSICNLIWWLILERMNLIF